MHILSEAELKSDGWEQFVKRTSEQKHYTSDFNTERQRLDDSAHSCCL